MKKIVVLCTSLLVILFSCSVNTQEDSKVTGTNDSIPLTKIEFDSSNFEFGSITQGEIVEHVFYFTNSGDKDLKIEDVQASCGCTTPEYTKDVVKPGEKGKIVVKFNSSNRQGHQSKTVNVFANTNPDMTQLHFTAEVKLPETK